MGQLSAITQAISGAYPGGGSTISRVPALEATATNLLLQSATFDNASWVKTNAAIVANMTSAPNGVVEADTLNDNSAVAIGTVAQAVAIPNDGLSRVFSCYFLPGTSPQTQISLSLTGGAPVLSSVDFNPASGQIIAQSGNAPTIESVVIGAQNWYRVSVSCLNNNSGNILATCQISPRSDNAGAQGTVIAWGAQLETGVMPTSQIPTQAVQRVRTAGVVPRWAEDNKLPTRTVLTAGAGNYNPPDSCIRIEVLLVGGGGGGAASVVGNGAPGTDTTFGALTASHGLGGGTGGGGGGAGGNAGAVGDIIIAGGSGSGGATDAASTTISGGGGASGPWGGAGGGGNGAGAGQNATANSGAGGGGGGGGSASPSGGGGGAGQYIEQSIAINNPPQVFAYTVGGGGAGGVTGVAGGAGGSGIIIITEYYT